MTKREADIAAQVRGKFRSALPPRLGIAVSGGGDSMALMHILSRAFEGEAVELMAVTVDHRLRPESADEARLAASEAARLGISHETLAWQEGPGSGNLQEQARNARYGLLTAWARGHGVPVLALGHTADDQAETVLMRLARAGGVSGLAAIPERRTHNGVTLFRPLLDATRADLRAVLRARGASWAEDPSNEDPRFDRVRMRKALEVLAPMGLSARALSSVAANMAQAREALDWYAFLAARDIAHVEAGAVVLDQRRYRTLPAETAYRLLVRALQWIGQSPYPPRRQPALAAAETLRRGGSATLAGCRVLTRAGHIWICREFNAVRETAAQPGETWDRRWRVFGGEVADGEVRALGRKGLAECPGWRETGRPGPVLEATPALWRGGKLAAAPLAGWANGWTAEPVQSGEDFFTSLLSH